MTSFAQGLAQGAPQPGFGDAVFDLADRSFKRQAACIAFGFGFAQSGTEGWCERAARVSWTWEAAYCA